MCVSFLPVKTSTDLGVVAMVYFYIDFESQGPISSDIILISQKSD